MEALTRIVADSLARHGLGRPVDPRRLQWSRWFRCDSPHSLLIVPSKPGIFALAEEIMDLGNAHVGTAAPGCPAEQSSASAAAHDAPSARRMLAVLQFSEADDMAFTLDRMFIRANPMRDRLASGRCFLRFVVIEDRDQRRTICSALNQWRLTSAEKATGIPADFSLSLELSSTDHVGRAAPGCPAEPSSAALLDTMDAPAPDRMLAVPPMPDFPRSIPEIAPPHLDSGAAKNIHCPHPLPSGF